MLMLLLFVRRAFLPKADNFWTTLQQSFNKMLLMMKMFEMGG